MAGVQLNKSVESKFDGIKKNLVSLDIVKEWEIQGWQTPESLTDIVQFLSKEGIAPDMALTSIAMMLGKEVYDLKSHGEPLQSGDGWILTQEKVWVTDPFSDVLPEMLDLRDRGKYSFSDYGIHIGHTRKIDAEDDEEIGDTELDGLMNEVLESALEKGASDIHISPRTSTTLSIQFRVDGHLQVYVHRISMKDYPAFANRILNRTGGYGGGITKPDSRKFTHPYNGRDTQIRLEVRPVVVAGNSFHYFVLRLLNASGGIRKLEEIGFEKHHYDILIDLCNRTKGLFLVTGPTGSGKTTTLYGILQKIRELRPGDSVQTLEDPVEVEVPGIEQTSMNPEAGMTFATGIRSAMRSDPEIILVGEIRDLETATQALVAAETGHLVLATLHTNSSAATISRLLSFGLDRVTLSNALIAISAQRMVRKVCKSCGGEVDFHKNPAYKERYGDLRLAPKEGETVLVANDSGCSKCDHGYSGRHVVCELMMIDPATEQMIIDGKPASVIEAGHVKHGFEPLWGHGVSLAAQHNTTIEELESRLEPRSIYGENFDYNKSFSK